MAIKGPLLDLQVPGDADKKQQKKSLCLMVAFSCLTINLHVGKHVMSFASKTVPHPDTTSFFTFENGRSVPFKGLICILSHSHWSCAQFPLYPFLLDVVCLLWLFDYYCPFSSRLCMSHNGLNDSTEPKHTWK